MNQFEKLGIDEDFNPFYAENNIKTPTEVQKKVIPKLLNNKSVICISQTGTGKTLSYALPLSENIKSIEDEFGLSQKRGKPFAIIVSPTKELALQIHDVFKSISHHVKLRIRTLVGASKSKISSQSFEILITTPTKLARAVKKNEISYDQLKYLVFDEADNLFEMGFKKDVESILFNVEYDQTDIHFFSATMPVEIEDFLDQKFKKKKLTKIQMSASHKVQQNIETFNINVDVADRNKMVAAFLLKTMKGRGIIFCNQKNQVKELEKYLIEKKVNIKFRSLHGDLSEKERLNCIRSFSNKKSQVLIATDVVARGIDIKDIKWVLNFNLPKTPIYYLHRSGRTARAGKSGVVYNFVTKYDLKNIAAINESIRSQSEFKMELIQTKQSRPKPKKKPKTKRVKITKRTKNAKR